MGSKTLIGGTAYEVCGGKTLINGTAYSIKKGKTLVDGTAREIVLVEDVPCTLTLSVANNAQVFVNGVSVSVTVTSHTIKVGDVIRYRAPYQPAYTQEITISQNGTRVAYIYGSDYSNDYGFEVIDQYDFTTQYLEHSFTAAGNCSIRRNTSSPNSMILKVYADAIVC